MTRPSIERALIVVAHPSAASQSHAIADRVAHELTADGIAVEIADLQAERFWPAMTQADIDHYRGQGPIPDDIPREQQRVDRADMLILVFPIYWWSMPALLRGWIERVFIRHWAYEDGVAGAAGTMRKMPVRLLATGGADQGLFDRHGYATAMQTQILHGIFDYCGLTDRQMAVFYEAEGASEQALQAFVDSARPMLGLGRGNSALSARPREAASSIDIIRMGAESRRPAR